MKLTQWLHMKNKTKKQQQLLSVTPSARSNNSPPSPPPHTHTQYDQLNSCMKAARSKRRKRADVNPVRNSVGLSRFDKHGIPSPCAIQAKDQTGCVKQSSVGVYDINHPA